MNRIYPSPVPAYTWLGLLVTAAVIGLIGGAGIGLVLPAVFGLSLPALGALLPSVWRPFGRMLQVFGWTVLAGLALVYSGGPSSPLAVLFLLGPLTGLALGRQQIALEATLFAGGVYVLFWILSFFAPLPPVPASGEAFLSALTLAAIVHAGMLCAAAVVTQGRRADREARQRIPAHDTGQTLELRGGVKLPSSLPVVAVTVTPHGRVRAVEGDPLLAGRFRLGELEHEFLGRISKGLAERLMETGSARLEYPSGLQVQWHRTVSEQGIGLVAYPLALPKGEAEGQDPQEIEAALRERTAFFASLGHDLKTPLNAIIGFSDMMKSGIRGPLPDGYRDYAEIIHESGEDLLLLVDDMLDLAKADAASLTLDLQPVDLAASGQSVMRQMGAAAERAGVQLTLKTENADDTWADADARAVRQIWQNLVSNAIKYSKSGDTVQLEVFAYPGRVVLAVEDEGAGMDAEDLARLAQPFAQGKNASGRKGTGLGLAVVKQFADLHGGQVKVDTRLGEGTRVEVTFNPVDPDSLSDFEEAAQ